METFTINSELIEQYQCEDTENQLEKKLSHEHFNKICRACLSDEDIKPFATITFGNMNCYQVFEIFTSLKVVKDDNFPQNMCVSCISEIIHMYTFRQKCLQNNKTLASILGKRKTEFCNYLEKNSKRVNPQTNEQSQITKDKTKKAVGAGQNIKNTKSQVVIDYLSDEQSSDHEKEMSMKSGGRNKDCTDYLKKSRRVVNSEGPPFICLACGEIFESLYEFKRHRKDVKHSRPRNHICNVCFKAFSYSHLKQHMRTHTKEKPFQCSLCQLRFSLNCNLRRHMMTHTGERPHTCDVCGKGFIQATTLIEHKRIHTGETPFVCSYCGKSFTQSARHKAHLRKHLIENGETDKLLVGETECKVCHRMFASKGVLKTHLLTHGEKTFLCSECGKGFVSSAGLRSHLKVHSGVRPYPCTVCKKSFSQLGSLKSHILIHTGLKPFTCHECSKAFTQRNHLKYHMRVHSGERPYKCTYCGKCFALNGTLTVHIRTHTGETPYVCDLCGKGFYDSSSMKKHRKGHGYNNAVTTSQAISVTLSTNDTVS